MVSNDFRKRHTDTSDSCTECWCACFHLFNVRSFIYSECFQLQKLTSARVILVNKTVFVFPRLPDSTVNVRKAPQGPLAKSVSHTNNFVTIYSCLYDN